jgi:transposase
MSQRTTVTLSVDEEITLRDVVRRGKANARTLARVHVLLRLHAGWSDAPTAEAVGVSLATVANVRRRYRTQGLDAVLLDQRQARRRRALTDAQAAHLMAIACSEAPDGHDHWTLRLLAGKAVELGFVRAISPDTIRLLLKKTTSSRGGMPNGASPP